MALYSVTSTGRAKSFIPSNSVLRDTSLLVESGGKYRIACRTALGAAQWYFPDGSAVPEDSNGHVYQLSHGDTGLAEMYISKSSVSDGTFPTGLYSCYAMEHTKGYIGLYLSGKSIASLHYIYTCVHMIATGVNALDVLVLYVMHSV